MAADAAPAWHSWIFWVILGLLALDILLGGARAAAIVGELARSGWFAGSAWTETPGSTKLVVLMLFLNVSITVATIALLLLRPASAFRVYVFALLPFVVTAATQVGSLGSFATREAWQQAGGIVGGAIQISLVLWGLWVLRRRALYRPSALFE